MTAGESAAQSSVRKSQHAQRLRERAERAEASARNYQLGHEGELAVATELERLRGFGYGYAADVRWPGTARANVDFLVFGPSGAFVIDAKNWNTRVTVSQGVLRWPA